VIAVVRDITEEKEQKELLRIQAETDGLTKILNRSSFVKYVEEELLLEDEDKKFATMLVIDVDYFKKVNDTYGHMAGDYVLIRIIEIIKTIIQDTCLIGRLGGEEFGIFTTQYNESQAKELAEEIRQGISQYPFDFKGNNISVTLSVGGVSVRNENARQFDTLFALADSALYEAKNEGRNRVNFYSKSR
jgi:diguanylate cyclase (GGDEF)-like protein